jgi:hypothetical protein
MEWAQNSGTASQENLSVVEGRQLPRALELLSIIAIDQRLLHNLQDFCALLRNLDEGVDQTLIRTRNCRVRPIEGIGYIEASSHGAYLAVSG